MANNSQYTGASIEATANSRIEIGVVTGTTSSYGDVSKQFQNSVIILSAWSPGGQTIVSFFPASGNIDAKGHNQWHFQCTKSDGTGVITGESVTVYFTFVKV